MKIQWFSAEGFHSTGWVAAFALRQMSANEETHALQFNWIPSAVLSSLGLQ